MVGVTSCRFKGCFRMSYINFYSHQCYRKTVLDQLFLYWEQSVCIQADNTFSKYIETGEGIRQECVFLTDLFHL